MNAAGRPSKRPQPCPCGGADLDRCCGPLLAGEQHAQSAERLMRSRYSAYALGDARYLLDTWHASARPATLDLSQSQQKWIGLEIRAARQLDATHAEVEFVARYRIGGRAHRLHETSRFERLADRWYYLAGDIHPV